jgi:hypothetical protein
MNAKIDLNEAMKFVPLRSQKAVLSILGPHFSPEMLAASVEYLERFEARPLQPNDVAEIIFKIVSDLTGVENIRDTTTRKRKLVFARQMAMIAVYTEVATMSYEYIGSLFNPKRDHATVMHACKCIEAQYASDKATRDLLNSLTELLAEHSLYSLKNRFESINLLN